MTLAENGAEATRVAQSVAVGSVLVETHLPDMSGEDLRSKILKARPDARVTVLTSFKLVRNTPALLRFGEDDYLLRAGQLLAPPGRSRTNRSGAQGQRRAENS